MKVMEKRSPFNLAVYTSYPALRYTEFLIWASEFVHLDIKDY